MPSAIQSLRLSAAVCVSFASCEKGYRRYMAPAHGTRAYSASSPGQAVSGVQMAIVSTGSEYKEAFVPLGTKTEEIARQAVMRCSELPSI